MKITECKFGEPYQIRDWDDMENEYGVDIYGSIKTQYKFAKQMKHLCGRTAMIARIEGKKIYLENWSDSSGKLNWTFTSDMLKPVKIDLKKSQIVDPPVECWGRDYPDDKWTLTSEKLACIHHGIQLPFMTTISAWKFITITNPYKKTRPMTNEEVLEKVLSGEKFVMRRVGSSVWGLPYWDQSLESSEHEWTTFENGKIGEPQEFEV